MLDIKFNTLWQPYERILRIRKWSTGIGVVLFLFVLFILWDYYRTKNEYFADYVDRWGIPEGVVELSAEQVKKEVHIIVSNIPTVVYWGKERAR